MRFTPRLYLVARALWRTLDPNKKIRAALSRPGGSLLEVLTRRDGAGAVEFALVAPAFVMILFGIVIYGTVFAAYIAVQQLAAEAARASVGGLNASERTTLATNYVTQNKSNYPLLNQNDVNVVTNPQTNSFQVTVTYNMANNPVFRLGGSIPLPGTTITGNAVAQLGGY